LEQRDLALVWQGRDVLTETVFSHRSNWI